MKMGGENVSKDMVSGYDEECREKKEVPFSRL